MQIKPQVYQVNQSYFILSGSSLQVQDKLLGKLFVVQDITREQTMFVAMVQSLSIVSILAIIVLVITIAFYIQAFSTTTAAAKSNDFCYFYRRFRTSTTIS